MLLREDEGLETLADWWPVSVRVVACWSITFTSTLVCIVYDVVIREQSLAEYREEQWKQCAVPHCLHSVQQMTLHHSQTFIPVLMHFLRIFRRRIVKHLFALTFILYSIFEIIQILHYHSRPAPEPVTRRPGRIYIVSLHWNNEPILRSHWNDAVVALTTALGQENVFVTIYESGSWDDSKGALGELDLALEEHGIRRNITLSNITHSDEILNQERGSGWVSTPRRMKELRRIPYLARLRNWTLEPLRELVKQGEEFDTVLFLNDVVFTVRFQTPTASIMVC